MPTCAYTRDERIQALGKVSQNFQSGGADMDLDVGRVLKLLRHPSTRGGIHQFLGSGDSAFHAFFAWRQIERSTVGQHQTTTFNGHAVRHDQDQFVALHSCHHGQAHTRVARGRFNDGTAGF